MRPILFAIVLFSGGTMAQEYPTSNYINERIAAHTKIDDTNYQRGSAMWKWLGRNDYDISAIGRAEVGVIRDEICTRWRAGDADLFSLAQLLNEMRTIQGTAVVKAFQLHLKTLPKRERRRIRQEVAAIADNHPGEFVVDNVGIAADLPEYFSSHIERLCQIQVALRSQKQATPGVVPIGDGDLTEEEIQSIQDSWTPRTKKSLQGQ